VVVVVLAVVGLTSLLTSVERVPTGAVAGATATSRAGATATSRAGRVAGSALIVASPSAGPSGPAAAAPSSVPSPSLSAPATAVTVQRVRSWRTAVGATALEILVGVRNTGTSPIELDAATSRYVVTDAKNGTVAVGRFTWALPRRVVPGDVGFLVARDSTPLVTPSPALVANATVSATLAPGNVDELRVTASRPRPAAGTLTVPLRITNPSSSTAANVAVGAVLLDARGRPLGALYDLAGVGPLAAGASVAFTLDYPPTGPIDAGAISRVLASAYELGA
jgi:hypothetical protein